MNVPPGPTPYITAGSEPLPRARHNAHPQVGPPQFQPQPYVNPAPLPPPPLPTDFDYSSQAGHSAYPQEGPPQPHQQLYTNPAMSPAGSQYPPQAGFAPNPNTEPSQLELSQSQPEPKEKKAKKKANKKAKKRTKSTASEESSSSSSSGSKSGEPCKNEAFQDEAVKKLFVRNVFTVLGIQLLVTFCIVMNFTLVKEIGYWIRLHPVVYLASFGVFLLSYFLLTCVECVRRKSPHNIITLIIFTLVICYMTGTMGAFHSAQAVMILMGVTTVACLSIILFSIQTKFEITKLSIVLFTFVVVLLICGVMCACTYSKEWFTQVLVGCGVAIPFAVFLAFDTQQMMESGSHELEPEEYIYAALTVYIDVIFLMYLFMKTLLKNASELE